MKASRQSVVFILVACIAPILSSTLVNAQQTDRSVNTNPIDPKTFGGMKWRLIGPFRGGRVLAVTGVPSQPNTYYFGAVAGGVWKTTDGGVSWDPLFDKQSTSSIGSIAVADSDPNVIYAGTGEACIRGNISFGDGVYKSTDAGKTWTNIGLKDTRHIGKVIVHPTNPDVAFVAALGHAYGPNIERGIFRTRDGGKTWEKVLYLDDHTGGIDIVFDPNNPHVLFAAMWEGYRTPWTLNSGGEKDGLNRSNDDGTTWKRIEGNGMPEGPLGRIGVGVSGADSNVVYALIEAKKGGLYRSDDGGTNWSLVNDDHRFRQRAWYFTHVWADPKNAGAVYIANTGLFRSTDGGKSFERINAPHGDHHGLWIDPNNPQRMINGNDGGATISIDGGKNWSTQMNQPTAQFYHVTADNDFPYRVYGTQQDNSSVGIATASDHGYIDRSDWDAVGGGESGYVAVDPRDSHVVYAGSYFGYISRLDRRTNQVQNIQQWPLDPDGYNAAAQKYRYTWTMPIVISPNDPNVLYHCAQVLFRSTDGGHSWQTISPDLTRNDKSKQQDSGGPITRDQASIEFYDLIFTVAESPKQKGQIWVGTDDGLIQLTRDDGKTWANVTPKGLPEWAMVSLIEASPFDAGTAYAAVDAHKLDNFKPYIFKTTDFGKTWTQITTGLPDGSYVHAVREDPKRKGLLFAGTETGIWVSFDDGAHWQTLQLELPTTPIHDLIVHDNDLVVATHGRAFWVLDDIGPLRQASASITAEDAHLFTPSTPTRTRMGHTTRRRYAIGENPPDGATLYYYLKSEPKEPAKLEVLDVQGGVLRSFTSVEKKPEGPPDEGERDEPAEHIPAKAGLNLFTWDLRYESPKKIPGAIYDEGNPTGPLVLPGKYQVQLTVAGKTYTAPVEVKMDPRVKTSAEDLRKQFDLMLKLRDRQDEMNKTILAIRDLRSQLQALEKRLEPLGDQVKSFVSLSADLRKKASAIEEELIQVNSKASEDELNYPTKLNSKIGYLQAAIDSADVAPTEGEIAVFAELDRQLEAQLVQWREVNTKDVPALNEAMRKGGIPLVGRIFFGGSLGLTPGR
ncbi:MAG TPA: hypothetical protein VHF01_14035 [Candidatus Acidoferrum sp.]|nr:hypothetical protein [Candidatus Acidoferrum sp.]